MTKRNVAVPEPAPLSAYTAGTDRPLCLRIPFELLSQLLTYYAVSLSPCVGALRQTPVALVTP